jgi:ketosteroid isomerase-like protein
VANDPESEELLAHVRSIFDAYLRRDRDAIRRLHTADWIGFQGPSARIERGLADYMVNAERSLSSFHGTGYELLDVEVQRLGELALVWYVARYDCRDAQGRALALPLRSVDVYRREPAGWNQCGSHISVIPSAGGWGERAPEP